MQALNIQLNLFMDQDHEDLNEEELEQEHLCEEDPPAKIDDVPNESEPEDSPINIQLSDEVKLAPLEFMMFTISLQDLLVLVLSKHTLPN